MKITLLCLCVLPCLTMDWTVAHQAPLSVGFSRQEYWRGLPLPTPGHLPNTGIKPTSSLLADGFFTTSATWEALKITLWAEDEMVGWHHRLNGHGFGWTLGVGDGQGGLACCVSRGCKEWQDWAWATELNWMSLAPPRNFLLEIHLAWGEHAQPEEGPRVGQVWKKKPDNWLKINKDLEELTYINDLTSSLLFSS